ncbi:MAG: S-layer homology domain-containing protein, partial [Firmicutes bacterium]|nr:S-layer homology domain-containing protein [Bacillota bacterium]
WYTDAIIWAAENGIVKGMTETTYEPETDISREQMAVMMYRYAEFKGADISAADDLAAFNDAANVSSWADKEMKWAVAVDLINGMGNNTLAPKNTATRAQAATVLMRFHENILK